MGHSDSEEENSNNSNSSDESSDDENSNEEEEEVELSDDSSSDSDSYIKGYRTSKHHPGKVKAHHWSYTGNCGPQFWHTLNPKYSIAKEGKQQSPINLENAKESEGVDIHYSYEASPISIINNGHTIQVNYAAGSILTAAGVEYELKQFHFHLPSEHTIEGNHTAMECHLVHQNNETKKLAVLGVFIELGAHNDVIDDVWNNLPPKMKRGKGHGEPEIVNIPKNINVSDLLPADKTLYRYSGSLTTPPCSEGVYWLLLKEPIQFDKQQIRTFKKIFRHNNRPTQEINERNIWISDELLD